MIRQVTSVSREPDVPQKKLAAVNTTIEPTK